MTVTVTLARDPARFIDAQRAFYRDDPHYAPPMTHFDRHQVDRGRNPFFEHADAEFWLAHRGREIVGRISAVRDQLHDEFHGDRVGFFGHFEARDREAAHALLERATQWLAERGATSLRGPVDLSTNYRCGLLIDGEAGPPFVMMPHNPADYAGHLESFGLSKAKDLVALMILEANLDMRRFERAAERVRARLRPTMRHVDLRKFDREVATLWSIYQDAWQKNWGFVPMTHDEFRAEAATLKQVVKRELTWIAEIDGKPAGMVLGVPDTNVAARACSGRLLPFGWWKFMRALSKVRAFRVLTLGVTHAYRNSGLESLLLANAVGHAVGNGFGTCEASWILEDNAAMLRPLTLMGGREYRRYRIYEKPLLPH